MKTWTCLLFLMAMQIQLSLSRDIYKGTIPKEDFEEHGLALDAIFGIGLRLQAFLNQSTPHNFVVSPISATVIVAQLLLGAEGEFREQLYDLLSLPGQSNNYNINYTNKNENTKLYHAPFHLQLSGLIKKLQKRRVGEEFTLKQSNALFYNQDIKLDDDFRRFMTGLYDSEITPLDFSKDTTSIINNWTSIHTNGLIKNILGSQPGPDTSALFFNAIYFLAEWETPFADILNRDDIFHINQNDTVVTTYMQGLVPEVPYAETKDYKLVCLPYKNNELGMYILLPKEDNPNKYSINQFSDSLNPAEVLQTIGKAKLRDAIVKIPKLSLSNTLRLLEPLRKYAEFKKIQVQPKDNSSAIKIIEDNVKNFLNFTPSARRDIFLSGAAENENLRVSDIVQQMIFSINEKGTEAAAVSVGITDYMGGSKTVILNRPFMFIILHEATRAVLFWGTIVDPSLT